MESWPPCAAGLGQGEEEWPGEWRGEWPGVWEGEGRRGDVELSKEVASVWGLDVL
jgi:hypothetical protein